MIPESLLHIITKNRTRGVMNVGYNKTSSLLESHTKKGDDLGVENGVTVAAEYSFKYPHHIVLSAGNQKYKKPPV